MLKSVAEIRLIIEKLQIVPVGEKRKVFVPPMKFVLMCGIDKPTYDNLYVKWKAGMLVGVEDECFSLVYNYVQQILGDVETRGIFGMCSPTMVRQIMESWCPSYGGANSKVKQENQKNIEKYKAIKKVSNDSGFEFAK